MILIRHGQSDFNAVFNRTRVDPGIPDPGLTEQGRRDAAAAAGALAGRGIRRLLASPYTRTLETAEIIARHLGVPVTIEPLVRERAYFLCDIGSHRSALARRWPHLDFDHVEERWWPPLDESQDLLLARCMRFRAAMAETADWRAVGVVTHWGFIRGLTGREVANGQLLGFDPVRGEARNAIEAGGDPVLSSRAPGPSGPAEDIRHG